MKLFGELMSAHTSMRVGGPAEVFAEPADEGELIELVHESHIRDSRYFLLGNGTNVIVRDKGYPGTVISTLKALGGAPGPQRFEPAILHQPDIFAPPISAPLPSPGAGAVDARVISCGAGEPLSRICRTAAERGLSGMEGLSGIPGTLGGAVFMNAGAYGYEISSFVESIRAYSVLDNNIIMLSKKDCEFGYRSSVFKYKPLVILSAELVLEHSDREKIETDMAEYAKKRNEKQPVAQPSAGSFFKRPQGDFAARLIEAAGMKGAEIGGAKISDIHAGFIINKGDATAADILALANEVKKKVKERFDIELEEEPLIIGV